MLKPFLFLVGSSLCLAGTAQAQVGLRVGGSLSKLHTSSGTTPYSSSGRSSAERGYQVGVTYHLPLTAGLALVPEVQYSAERTTLTERNYAIPDVGYAAESRLRFHYLNVPVLVRATLGPVYVEAGPQASLLLGGHHTGTFTTTGWGIAATTQPVDQPITERNRRFDAGACVGVGVKLSTGLGISVRAYRGLGALNYERWPFEGDYQRQSLQASLTYQLPARQ